MMPPIGDDAAKVFMAQQLRLKLQDETGITPDTSYDPAAALLMNRVLRVDAALYVAEMAMDLKYNHGDDSLYNGVMMLSRMDVISALGAQMIASMEGVVRDTQAANVEPSTDGKSPPVIKGVDFTNEMRRGAFDDAMGNVNMVQSFDEIVISAYEAYFSLPAQARQMMPAGQQVVSDSGLSAIGKRPGDEGDSYLTGGRELKSAFYLQSESTDHAMRVANILLRLSGLEPPRPAIPHAQPDKGPRSQTAGYSEDGNDNGHDTKIRTYRPVLKL